MKPIVVTREQVAILHRLALQRPIIKRGGRLSERSPGEQKLPPYHPVILKREQSDA